MDKVLKQRLIGASILIALAVIFVPMLFDSPESDSVSREMNIELSSAPGDRANVRRLPLNPDQSRATAQQSESDDSSASTERIQPPRISPRIEDDRPSSRELMAEIEAQAESQGMDQAPVVQPEPVVESTTEEAAEATSSNSRLAESEPVVPETAVADPVEPATANTAPASSQASESAIAPISGFEVQVASFGSLENADALVERLARLGHVASIDRLVRGPSELHRVRTGPYLQREDAERALEQIRQTISGVDPVIVGSSASVDSNQPDGAGFAVQVGSFASRNNAVRLLDQLAGQGYEAFVHEDMAGSRTIWRVRVGPLVTRDEAVQRLARMTADDNIDGLVVSHP